MTGDRPPRCANRCCRINLRGQRHVEMVTVRPFTLMRLDGSKVRGHQEIVVPYCMEHAP